MPTLRDVLDRAVQVVASTMVAAIFLITLAQVVLRYGFSIALPWSAETAQLLLVYTVMLVAAYGAGRGSHFAVTALADAVPPAVRRWLGRINSVLIAVFCAVVLVYGTRLALGQMGTRLPALGLPVGFVYLSLPIGAALTLLYLLAGVRAPAGDRER